MVNSKLIAAALLAVLCFGVVLGGLTVAIYPPKTTTTTVTVTTAERVTTYPVPVTPVSTPAGSDNLPTTQTSLNGTIYFTLSNQALNLTQIISQSDPYTNAISTALMGSATSAYWVLQVQLVNDSLVVPPGTNTSFDGVSVYFQNATSVVIVDSVAGQTQLTIDASITGTFFVGPLEMHQLNLQWKTSQ